MIQKYFAVSKTIPIFANKTFSFFFYSREHEPIHVHVEGNDGYAVYDLDEDISLESFTYEDAVPSTFQEFFLVHKEINVSEFAKRIDINASLMRNYINGFKKPSKMREREIINAIHDIGKEYISF